MSAILIVSCAIINRRNAIINRRNADIDLRNARRNVRHMRTFLAQETLVVAVREWANADCGVTEAEVVLEKLAAYDDEIDKAAYDEKELS